MFFLSLLFNLFFLVSDVLLEYKIWKVQKACNTISLPVEIGDGSTIAEQSFSFIKEGWYHYLPKSRGSSVDNLKFNLYNIAGVSQYHAYESSEELYLQIALYENAIIRNDSALKNRIEKLFDDKILNKKVKALHQCTAGILAMDMYIQTKQTQYKNFVDSVYSFLLEHDIGQYGCVFSENLAEVDENGMVVPFLCRYYERFHNKKAYDMAIKQIDFYACNGTDETTGLPFHAINLTHPIMHIGEVNWGRGYAWWTMGLTPISVENLSVKARSRVALMDSMLVNLWNNDKKFSTLVRQTNEMDLSATLPILHYLVKKNLVRIDDELINSFSIYMHNGLLYNCSGPKDGLTVSNFYQPNPLAQAYLFFLINANLKKRGHRI